MHALLTGKPSWLALKAQCCSSIQALNCGVGQALRAGDRPTHWHFQYTACAAKQHQQNRSAFVLYQSKGSKQSPTANLGYANESAVASLDQQSANALEHP